MSQRKLDLPDGSDRDPMPFTKVYPKGWSIMRKLAKDDPASLGLYCLLADKCGHDNSLSATYATLAKELDVCERTVRSAVRRLEASGDVVVLKHGSANVYVLDCDQAWKTHHRYKHTCSFRTRTLLPAASGDLVRRRLTVAVSPDNEGQRDD